MKIQDITKIYGVYETQPPAGRAARKVSPASQKDRLMLSRDAIDFQTVMKGLKEAPDVRADKIAEHSVKYAAGDHLADTRDIANALYKSGAMRKTLG